VPPYVSPLHLTRRCSSLPMRGGQRREGRKEGPAGLTGEGGG
jgi:hypothetical protein